MNKNALSPWVLSQVVLSGLGLFLFHALITKQYRGAPLTRRLAGGGVHSRARYPPHGP